MSESQYRPGDIANGHQLGNDNVWRPVDSSAQPTRSQPEHKPGDIVNGYRLDSDNVWRPAGESAVRSPALFSTAAPGSTGSKSSGLASWVRSHKVLSGIAVGALFIAFIAAATSGEGEQGPVAASKPSSSTSSASGSPADSTVAAFVMPSDAEIAATLDAAWNDSMLDDVSDAANSLEETLKDKFGAEGDFYSHASTYVDAKQQAKEAADAKAAAAAKAKRAAAIKAAEAPTKRQLAKIVKDPEAYSGKYYVVYGEITQFDAATGTDAFRADVAHKNTTSYGFFEGDNSILTGSESALTDFVAGDVFMATVKVTGPYSYDTQIGGSTTVPMFEIVKIKRVGNNS